MRNDMGWLYLLAGAGAVGAAVIYKRSQEEGDAPAPQPLGFAPPPAVLAAGKAALHAAHAAKIAQKAGAAPKPARTIQHVDLRGDELAVSLAPPLARLLATRGASLEDRFARPGWSPTDAEMRVGPKPDVLLLAVGPAKGVPPSFRADLASWGHGREHPTIVLLHPRAPIAKEIYAAGRVRPATRNRMIALRDLPLGPDGITPTMATAAAWAADIVQHLGG